MHVHDRVAQEWYDKDWDMPPEIAFLSRHGLDGGSLVFDLGAHQCLVAMLLAKQLTSAGRVVAVEANRHNARIAQSNIELNAVTNVTVRCAMVSNRVGTDRAATSFNSSHNESRIAGEEVDAVTVDALAAQYGVPRVIYMDIEGFEIEALKGAKASLARPITWFVELHGDATLAGYGSANSDILKFFPSDRFAAYICGADETEFRPLATSLPTARCFLVFVPIGAAVAPAR
jgi:FkbM family methyltransferase